MKIDHESISGMEQKIHKIIDSGEEAVLIIGRKYRSNGYEVTRKKFYNISKDNEYFVCYDFEDNLVEEDMFLYNVLDNIFSCTTARVSLFRGGEYEPDRT